VKPKGRWSPKVIAAIAALSGISAFAVIIIISQVLH
jgi:hypothetical protein